MVKSGLLCRHTVPLSVLPKLQTGSAVTCRAVVSVPNTQPPAFSNRSPAKPMFNSAFHSENSDCTCYRAVLTRLKQPSTVFAEHQLCHLIHSRGNVERVKVSIFTGYRTTADTRFGNKYLLFYYYFTRQEMQIPCKLD